MKKISLIFIIFLIFTVISYGQGDTLIDSLAPEFENAGNDVQVNNSSHRLKPHWNVMMGSNFNYSSAFGSSTGIFVAPMVSIPLNNRLSLRGGVVASHTNLYSMGMSEALVPFQNFNELSVFGSASYMLSENVEVYGTATRRLKELPVVPYPFMPSSPNSFTIGTNWRIGNNISIGASFTKTDRYFPFYNTSPITPHGSRSFFP